MYTYLVIVQFKQKGFIVNITKDEETANMFLQVCIMANYQNYTYRETEYIESYIEQFNPVEFEVYYKDNTPDEIIPFKGVIKQSFDGYLNIMLIRIEGEFCMDKFINEQSVSGIKLDYQFNLFFNHFIYDK